MVVNKLKKVTIKKFVLLVCNFYFTIISYNLLRDKKILTKGNIIISN